MTSDCWCSNYIEVDQTPSPVLTLVFRPLPIPPYPGVIPYTVDQPEESQNTSGGEQLLTSPRLLGIEHRPVSVGSFGPPSNQTVPGLAAGTLSEEQVRDKFYAYWTRQKVRLGTHIVMVLLRLH